MEPDGIHSPYGKGGRPEAESEAPPGRPGESGEVHEEEYVLLE